MTDIEDKDKKIEVAIKNIKSPSEIAKLLTMKKMSDDFKGIMKSFEAEVEQNENKYYESKFKIDEKINKIVKNITQIELSNEEKKTYQIKEPTEPPKEIEDYWSKVLTNSKYFTINVKDIQILKYLTNVTLESDDNQKGDFTIIFKFKENQYFSNSELRKRYIYLDKDKISAEVTEIEWNSEDKNPTIKKETINVKKGKKILKKEVVKEEESFFSFFNKKQKGESFIKDETIFFKNDLFDNQLEYYLNLRIGEVFGKDEIDDDLDDYDDIEEKDEEGGEKKKKKRKKKKEESKNQ